MSKILKAFHPSEKIVDIITFKDHVYVATNKMVYKIVNDVLVKLTIQLTGDDNE